MYLLDNKPLCKNENENNKILFYYQNKQAE